MIEGCPLINFIFIAKMNLKIIAQQFYTTPLEDCERLNNLSQSIPLICWLNSEVHGTHALSKNIHVINPGESTNFGLAYGINMINDYIIKLNLSDHILTLLDQDTLVSPSNILELAQELAVCSSSYPSYVSPAILSSTNEPWISWFSITNGLTLYASDLHQISPLPTILMADCVDIVMCDKLRKNIKQHVLKSLVIPHNVGAGIKEHIFPDISRSLKQKRYVRQKYFYHPTLSRNLMKFHAYGFLFPRVRLPGGWRIKNNYNDTFHAKSFILQVLKSFIYGLIAKPL